MYVYILESISHNPTKHYTGITSNPKQRLQEHNTGKCKTTSAFRPWKFKNVIWFLDTKKAREFERYLKSGSGRAFVKYHF